ncbi:MAG: hypothetical protein IJC67_03780 [Clostridia bacterium]|nr:hypothetical protein [Clostridia bacterium]
MDKYKGRNGKVYELGKRLGHGGEGDVYEVNGHPDLVAKIYKSTKFAASPEGFVTSRDYMREKIETMLDQPVTVSRSGAIDVAWPKDILLDGSGDFVGYTMPYVRDKYPLYFASREYERNQFFRGYTWKTGLAVAINLSAAIKQVHDAGAVVGDLNPNNILIDKNGSVTLIDTDSFNITNQKTGKVYKCCVGVPNMLPPELQGVDLSKEQNQFTCETDSFSLAIHIFTLLANNIHPFNFVNTGSYQQSSTSNTQDRNIAKGNCPYVTGSKLDKNDSAPDMAMFPAEIRTLFDRMFTYTSVTAVKKEIIRARPSVEEWWVALYHLYTAEMTTCKKEHSHVYPKSYTGTCPWCAIERRKNLPAPNKSVSGQSAASGARTTAGSGSTAGTSGTSTHVSRGAGARVAAPRRGQLLLWMVCIICGVLSGPIFGELALIVLNGEMDLGITCEACVAILSILGALIGCGMAFFLRELYMNAYNGWPWLLLGLTVPLATLAAAAIVTLVLAVIVGIISVIVGIIVLIAALAFCSGG